jgi:hypothetical protein
MDDTFNYDPSDGAEEVGFIATGGLTGFFWIRLEDTTTGEIEDIPVNGDDVVYWWSYGVGKCDCVRYRAFMQNRNQNAPNAPCGHSRMRLLGIWNRGKEQIHPGE